VASSNADQNGRQWPFATTRVRTRRHTTLLSERGAFTDGICEASLSLESQAESLPGGQDYKPAQRHFVNIFSAQAHRRFNSRPIGPETSEKAQSQLEKPISYRRRRVSANKRCWPVRRRRLLQGGDGFGVAVFPEIHNREHVLRWSQIWLTSGLVAAIW